MSVLDQFIKLGLLEPKDLRIFQDLPEDEVTDVLAKRIMPHLVDVQIFHDSILTFQNACSFVKEKHLSSGKISFTRAIFKC